MGTDITEKFLVYLNMLHALSISEKAKKTQSAIRSIVDLLNYEYFRQNEIVTLGEEIIYAKILIEIFKYRFGNKLKFTESIEDNALKVYIPHYTIMAFVENALTHGLEPKEGDWNLEIKALLEGEKIVITIEDNGVGFDTKQALLQNGNGDNKFDSIKNVISRLKLHFNGHSQVNIKSCIGSGTRIKIILPA